MLFSRKEFLLDRLPKIIGAVGLSIYGFSLLGCTADGFNRSIEKQFGGEMQEILAKRGLNGRHNLVDLREIAGASQQGVNTGFILGKRKVNDEEKLFLKFAWELNLDGASTIVQSEIPFDKVMIIKRDEEIPAGIAFDFKAVDILVGGKILDSDNPNDYMKRVARVRISMSKKDYARFNNSH